MGLIMSFGQELLPCLLVVSKNWVLSMAQLFVLYLVLKEKIGSVQTVLLDLGFLIPWNPMLLQFLLSLNLQKKLMWESVADLYGSQDNLARVFELKLEIAVAQQGDKGFSEHLGNMKRLWDELNLYRPHTIDPKVLLQRAEEDKIFSLLRSLKPEYEYIRKRIFVDTTLPSLNNVCSIVQREETRMKTMNIEMPALSEKVESTVLLARQPSGSDNGKKVIYHCDHCNKDKHTKDRCWVLHPHLKPKSEKKRTGHAAIADAYISMNQLGHLLLQQLSKSMTYDKGHSRHASGTPFPSNSNSWIIDSGATDHMANSPSSVFNFAPNLNRRNISVANGSTVPVLGNGKINFFPHSSTSDAFVVPSFHVQLLSVGKITNSLNCDVHFSSTSIIFQD